MKHIYIYTVFGWLRTLPNETYLIFVMEQLEANSITLEFLSVL